MKKLLLILCALHIFTIPLFSKQARLAVLDFKADGVSRATSRRISELIRVNIINSRNFLIIERAQMGRILNEQGFQQSGCVEVVCAVKVGKILSANKILVGTVMKLGKSTVLTARVVDVEKGISEFSHDQKIESADKLYENVKAFSRKLSKKLSDKNYSIEEDEEDEYAGDKDYIIDEAKGTGINRDFVDRGDGTIYDKKTGKIWAVKKGSKLYSFSEAIRVTEKSKKARFQNWRLPTREELQRLLPRGDLSVVFYLKKLGLKHVTDYYYWTLSKVKGQILVLEMATGTFELSDHKGKYRVVMVSDKLED